LAPTCGEHGAKAVRREQESAFKVALGEKVLKPMLLSIRSRPMEIITPNTPLGGQRYRFLEQYCGRDWEIASYDLNDKDDVATMLAQRAQAFAHWGARLNSRRLRKTDALSGLGV
jgi:hypothetical protein